MANTLKFGNSEWYGSEGNILAYNDLNGNFKPLPFDFSRGSSATRVNQQGLIETVGANDARVDYLNNANGALKLEPSRTNSFPYSQDFANSDWGKNSSGIDTSIGNNGINENIAISPDGTLNSDRVNFLLQSDLDLGIGKSISSSSGTTWSASVWIKGEGSNIGKNIGFRLKRSSGGSYVGNDGTIELTSEWVRIEINQLTLIANNNGVRLILSSNDATSCLIYGAQLEEGSYATSYIPTQGSAVTRLADSCSQTVPSGVIGQTEGTLLADFNFDGDISGNRSVAVLSSAGSVDFIASFIFNNLFYARIRANNGSLIDVTKSNLTSGNHKIAIAYASNDLTFYLDGNIVGQNTSASVSFASELSTIKIGESTSGTAELGGLVSNTSLYNTRLSNSELAALTQV